MKCAAKVVMVRDIIDDISFDVIAVLIQLNTLLIHKTSYFIVFRTLEKFTEDTKKKSLDHFFPNVPTSFVPFQFFIQRRKKNQFRFYYSFACVMQYRKRKSLLHTILNFVFSFDAKCDRRKREITSMRCCFIIIRQKSNTTKLTNHSFKVQTVQ